MYENLPFSCQSLDALMLKRCLQHKWNCCTDVCLLLVSSLHMTSSREMDRKTNFMKDDYTDHSDKFRLISNKPEFIISCFFTNVRFWYLSHSLTSFDWLIDLFKRRRKKKINGKIYHERLRRIFLVYREVKVKLESEI